MPPKLDLTPADALARKNEQNRLRQLKYRTANRDAVNERRRELNKIKKQTKPALNVNQENIKLILEEEEEHKILNFEKDFKMQPAPKAKKLNKKLIIEEDKPVKINKKLPFIIESDSDEEFILKPKKKVATKKASKVISLMQKEVDTFLQSLQGISRSQSSVNIHKANLERFFKATNCDNAVKCFNDYNNTLNKLDTYVQTSGKSTGLPFALNTKKGIYNSICLILDTYPNLSVSKINNEKWHTIAKEFNYASHTQTEVNKELEVPNLIDYTDNLKNIFGDDSKLFIVWELFIELNGARDDFDLVLVDSKNKADNEENNYLILPKKGNAIIIINNFKTKKGYLKKNKIISKYLTNKITKYITENKIENGALIFGKSQSDLISKSNKKMGYNQDVDDKGIKISNGSINMWRKMLRTFQQEQNPNMTDAELIKMAEDMQHSAVTHNQYLRKTKK
jgi:hypothetical protein